jgi:hypothetical protein
MNTTAASLLAEARALPGRIDEARKTMQALSLRRGAVLAELTAPGAAYYRRIPALAAELGCHRSTIDEALAAHRRDESLTGDIVKSRLQMLASLKADAGKPSDEPPAGH